MNRRRFFYAFRSQAPGPGYTAQIKHDEPLTPPQLKAMPAVLYKRELDGRWLDASLSEIVAEFERRRAGGTLPPENMVAPPKEKAETRVRHGYREARAAAPAVHDPRADEPPAPPTNPFAIAARERATKNPSAKQKGGGPPQTPAPLCSAPVANGGRHTGNYGAETKKNQRRGEA